MENNKKQRKEWLDIALLIVIYLISTIDVVSIFIDNTLFSFIGRVSLRTIFIIFALFFVKKTALTIIKPLKFEKEHLLLIPLFIVVFSNWIVVLVDKTQVLSNINTTLMIQGISLDFLSAFAEEVVFRLILISQFLKIKGKFQTILYSSLIFASSHLINISSLETIIPVLLQVGYTFFLGIGLAFMYVITQKFIWSFMFHFTFNVINGTVVRALFTAAKPIPFYTINVLVGILAVAYGIWLYKFFKTRGEKVDVAETMDI
ncbi:MAG: CPBP family intramembrane glutamic endopeptidase [Bacilli bacterium]|jgi:membrane protease YdiL (CAAX protease family)